MPHSVTCWCNAIVLVRKKGGTLCFCVDFCNSTMYKEGLLSSAMDTGGTGEHGWCCTFLHDGSMMDFKSGFWQVKMVPILNSILLSPWVI